MTRKELKLRFHWEVWDRDTNGKPLKYNEE